MVEREEEVTHLVGVFVDVVEGVKSQSLFQTLRALIELMIISVTVASKNICRQTKTVILTGLGVHTVSAGTTINVLEVATVSTAVFTNNLCVLFLLLM